LAAVVIVVMGIFVGTMSANIIAAAAVRTGITYGKVLGDIARYGILVITIVVAIDQVGIDIAFLINLVNITLTAILFGAALAFGLGARTSVSNILASYYVHKTYKEGNSIKIGDVEGLIVKITPTSVIVSTKDGQVSIPAKRFSEMESSLIEKH